MLEGFQELKKLLINDYSMTKTNYECHATTPQGFSPLIGVTNFKHEYLSKREELRSMPYINENISTSRNHKKKLLIIDYSMTTTNDQCHATSPWCFSPLTGVTNFKHEYLSNRKELFGMPYINGSISTSRIHLEDP